jgi:hypothetical protein
MENQILLRTFQKPLALQKHAKIFLSRLIRVKYMD